MQCDGNADDADPESGTRILTSKKYFKAAKAILTTLTSDKYIAKEGANGGFLLEHGVGHIPQKSEIDVPLTYGDYYLVEALLRYKKQTN